MFEMFDGPMASVLSEWQEWQQGVSQIVSGTKTPEVDNDFVTRTCFSLIGEVFELAQEVGWKNWKENPPMTPEQKETIAEEFADVMAFFGLLLYTVTARTGLTFEDLVEAYELKSYKNIARFRGETGEAGYNGVTNE